MIEEMKQLLANRGNDDDAVAPVFFRLVSEPDYVAMASLLKARPHIRVFDSLERQLQELVESSHPGRTLNPEERKALVEAHLGDVPMVEYGVWVYYPWNDTLVHMLDEEEFVNMRTNRNRYKITDDEQALLRTKRIGVIGLSVGQSVSLALAMERGCGELRIADFDELEITNLNRLRSGVQNLGLKKTVIVAREIAEIDPFLTVKCFHEGITEANLASFLLGEGKLDLLIDECDGIAVKLNCRIMARQHGIPVIMEASDRGTVDVERFDLEPNRPILHGYVDHLDLSAVTHLKTNEEKLPYILAFAGVETLSVRMKASAIEVGQSISTWPQLASAVVMGGGMVADVCRRLLLGQFHQSGRYFVDLEELIGDPKTQPARFDYRRKSLSEAEMMRAAARVPAFGSGGYAGVGEQLVMEVVRAATLAPSPGNNQPWKWYYDGGLLYLFHDIARSESLGDFDNMASYMTFGAAIENLKLKCGEVGLRVEERLFPLPDEPLLVAAFTLSPSKSINDELVDYIGRRVTNRKPGDGRQIGKGELVALRQSIAQYPDVALRLLSGRDDLIRLATIAGKADKLRLFIPQGHHELFEKELRRDVGDADGMKDGLDIRTLELSPKDEVGFRVARDPRAMKLIARWNLGKALENLSGNSVLASSSMGLITVPAFNPVNCIEAGRAIERLWLTAEKHAISLHPMLASVLHFARLRHGNGIGMPNDIQQEFRALEREFNDLFDIDPSVEVPLFLFRLFKGVEPTVRSLRMDLKNVFFSKDSQ